LACLSGRSGRRGCGRGRGSGRGYARVEVAIVVPWLVVGLVVVPGLSLSAQSFRRSLRGRPSSVGSFFVRVRSWWVPPPSFVAKVVCLGWCRRLFDGGVADRVSLRQAARRRLGRGWRVSPRDAHRQIAYLGPPSAHRTCSSRCLAVARSASRC